MTPSMQSDTAEQVALSAPGEPAGLVTSQLRLFGAALARLGASGGLVTSGRLSMGAPTLLMNFKFGDSSAIRRKIGRAHV